ncbi:hypothetical protein [Catellatospora paridis]|uniref:hypothetical protein n=1 Tax=Catellatospora paridis TaxID=1617086 RepID=UPI0012D44701|nr:hypothetical protein [Catellatospora paridis]
MEILKSLGFLCLGVMCLGVLVAVVPMLSDLVAEVQSGELNPMTWIVVGVVIGALCLCAAVLLD